MANQLRAGNIRANLQGVMITLSNYKGVNGSNWCWVTYINTGPASSLVSPGISDCDGLQRGNGMFFRLDFLMKQRLANITDAGAPCAGQEQVVFPYHRWLVTIHSGICAAVCAGLLCCGGGERRAVDPRSFRHPTAN